MGFNTLPFVFVFLPLFLAAFYLVPARWRAGLLCLGSLVFYVIGVWQRPWCLAPLLGLAVLVYLLGLRMRPREEPGDCWSWAWRPCSAACSSSNTPDSWVWE